MALSLFPPEGTATMPGDINDIQKIIKLKTICPDKPVWIALDNAPRDIEGQSHGVHVYRLDQIITNNVMKGDFEFQLINPYHNQAHCERLSLDEITRRHPLLYTNTTSQDEDVLLYELVNHPLEQGVYIFANHDLRDMMAKVYKYSPKAINFEYYIKIYKQFGDIAAIFNRTDENQQKVLTSCINASKGYLSDFMKSLTQAQVSKDISGQISLAVANHSEDRVKKLDDLRQEIKEFPKPIKIPGTVLEIRAKKQLILDWFSIELKQAKTEEDILSYFRQIKAKYGPFAIIHRNENSLRDRFRLWLKRPENPGPDKEKLLYTPTFIKAMGQLKRAYLPILEKELKINPNYTPSKEAYDLINFFRDNKPIHLGKTRTRKAVDRLLSEARKSADNRPKI